MSSWWERELGISPVVTPARSRMPVGQGLGSGLRFDGMGQMGQTYADAGRSVSNFTREMLFGPERQSAFGSGQASRPERFARDWGLSEQEFNLARQRASESRPGATALWGGLGLAGIGFGLPLGRIIPSIRAAISRAPVEPPRPSFRPTDEEIWGPGVILSGPTGPTRPTPRLDAPPGPTPRRRTRDADGNIIREEPPAPPRRRTQGFDEPFVHPGPTGPTPPPSRIVQGPGTPAGPPPGPTGPTPRRRSREELDARREANERVAAERESARAAQEAALAAQENLERLAALRAVLASLQTKYVPEITSSASMGQRTGPLADLRITSGTSGIESGSRASIHDVRIPFDEAISMPLSQRMSRPFLESDLVVPRTATPSIEDFVDRFRHVDGVHPGGGWRSRPATPAEIARTREALNDIAPSFADRFVERAPGVHSPQYTPHDFNYGHMQNSWIDRVDWAINNRAKNELLDEVALQTGRAPYYRSRDAVDEAALLRMIEELNAGTVSTRMHPEGLEYLLRTGIAPTGHRTHRTGAGDSNNLFRSDRRGLREATEFGNFGLPINADPMLRPHYGYVQGREGLRPFLGSDTLNPSSVRSYGPVTAEWSDAVRANSSFTMGDSLNMMTNAQGQVPRPLLRPSVEDILFAGGGRRAGAHGPTYAEVQMFGGPRLEDLTSLRVASSHSSAVQDLLRRYNVDVPVTVTPDTWVQPRM